MNTNKQAEMDVQSSDLPNGPVAAAFLAGGIGSAALGLMTVLNEASEAIHNALIWSVPVGPLSGKVGVGVIVFFVSWLVLYLIYRGKHVDFKKITTLAFVLLAVGLLLTFPPVFLLFASE